LRSTYFGFTACIAARRSRRACLPAAAGRGTARPRRRRRAVEEQVAQTARRWRCIAVKLQVAEAAEEQREVGAVFASSSLKVASSSAWSSAPTVRRPSLARSSAAIFALKAP
jgi:hypothetical protein